MSTILADIVARKREELVNQKATLPINSLRELIKTRYRPANLAGTLKIKCPSKFNFFLALLISDRSFLICSKTS